jgi:7-carboxy-7-deazaguanine synthase
MGNPCLFIRLAGCNLKCEFCDTRFAWSGGREMGWADLKRAIRDIHKGFPASWICLTGGEPFLQDITFLTARLKESGFSLQIETNATLHRPVEVDWLTISPKPPDYFIHPLWVKKAKEAKLVVTEDLSLDIISGVRDTLPESTPLLLQPQSNLGWSRDKGYRLLKKTLVEGLPNIRLSLQLHKVYDIK